MTYVDQDGDPSTVNSSVTNLTLDPSAEVVFAGLYWSGDVPAKAGDGTLGSARLTDPTGVQTDVVAERVDHATASSRDVYQAFADVTDQVSQGGAGKWTFGGAVAGDRCRALRRMDARRRLRRLVPARRQGHRLRGLPVREPRW